MEVTVVRKHRDTDYFPQKSTGGYVNNGMVITNNSTVTTFADGLKTGGYVALLYDLVFSVSSAFYHKSNVAYYTGDTTVTLEASDATHTRIDVIAVNTSSQVVVLKGVASATPQKPTINPSTQIELTSIIVEPNVTEIAEIVTDIIYDENVEWTPSAVGQEFLISDFGYIRAGTPNKGNICADISYIGNFDIITFTKGSVLTKSEYATVSFFIRLKRIPATVSDLSIRFLLDGRNTGIQKLVQFDKHSLSWQQVTCKISDFKIDTEYDAIEFAWLKATPGTYYGLYLDNIVLQKGIGQRPDEDTFVIGLTFEAGVLSIFQNNGRPQIDVNISGLIHSEKGTITALDSRTVTVVFGTPFETQPLGLNDFKVYRYYERSSGSWIVEDVLHSHTNNPFVSLTGFDVVIDEDEALEGVIIEYNFIE